MSMSGRFSAWLGAGAAAAVLAGAGPGRAQAAAETPPPPYRAMAHDILKQLVEIDSTHAHGSTLAAQAIERWAIAAGFPREDVTVLAPPDHPTKGNAVVRLRGKGPGKPLLILGHLDVVEANPADWTTDPFKLVEKDGYYYGRGTEDMKGEDACMLTTLIRLKQEGFVPDRDIVVAFTADEEAGGDADGPQWLLASHRDLMDASLALNQDGGGPGLRNGKVVFLGVETSEKLYATFELETTNRGGHSSLPRADNAIYELDDGLERLAHYSFPVHLTQTSRAFFQAYAALTPGGEGADMLAVSGPQADPAAARRLSADPLMNALLRTTCVTTMVRAGVSESALPSRAHATVQCRLIPGETPDDTLATLKRVVNDPAIKLTVDLPIDPSPQTPPSPAVFARYAQAAHPGWPDVPVIPTLEPGASDSVYTRLAGMPSFVSGAIPVDIDDSRAHGRDERIGVEAFYQGVAYDYRLFKLMSAAGDPVREPQGRQGR